MISRNVRVGRGQRRDQIASREDASQVIQVVHDVQVIDRLDFVGLIAAAPPGHR